MRKEDKHDKENLKVLQKSNFKFTNSVLLKYIK